MVDMFQCDCWTERRKNEKKGKLFEKDPTLRV
jgi:hypothetical protein